MSTTRKNGVRGAERELRIAELERDAAQWTAKVANASDPVERAKANLELVKLRYELTVQLRRRTRRADLGQRPLPFQSPRPQVRANHPSPDDEVTALRAHVGELMAKLDQNNAHLRWLQNTYVVPLTREEKAVEGVRTAGYVAPPLPTGLRARPKKVFQPGVAVDPSELDGYESPDGHVPPHLDPVARAAVQAAAKMRERDRR